MFPIDSLKPGGTVLSGLFSVLMTFSLAGHAKHDDGLADKIIRAHGGAAAISALASVAVEGQIQLYGGFPGSFKIMARAPHQFRMDWDIGYASDVLSIDGPEVWQSGVSARQLAGAEQVRLNRIPLLFRLGELKHPGAELSLASNEPGEQGSLTLRFRDTAGRESIVLVDEQTYLIRSETRIDPWEEGPTGVAITYSDYREVQGQMLPYEWRWFRPDMKMRVLVDQYLLDADITAASFAYPHSKAIENAPYQLSISTLPENIYKEDDGQIVMGEWYRGWGTPYAPSESWIFHAVINERFGRHVEPERAILSLYSGDELLRTVILEKSVLDGTRSYPAARFNSLPEIYNFRHAMHEVTSAAVDRINYEFQGRAPQGDPVSVRADFPLSRYQLKNSYIFPLKGKFIIPNAHDYDMLFHTYERSQHFSYDVLALGPDFELARNGGATSADFFSFRKTEIIAPAGGIIVYARNDVPDIATSEEYLRTVPDPKKAIGGNLMIIDHGQGEYSLLAHMAQGTVRVKTGDRVEQGEVLGLLGSAGSGEGFPHLHYQLQAGPGTFENDPLPVVFDNVSNTGFFKIDGATVLSPGMPYEAH